MNTDLCKLSIVIPCFNEEATLSKCVENVLAIADNELSLEVIIVDDYSSDKSLKIANALAGKFIEVKVFYHQRNLGKGAALRTGFEHATGDFVAVQDADLEYDPNDLKRLIKPLLEGKADVTLGSRFLSSGTHRVLYFWHSLGNKFLTFLSNIFSDLNLTDMETCYKVFRRDVIQSIEIKENRFGFEPEIVAKIAQRRLRIYEMGISYYGRTYEEGKKIGAKDGFRALYCIFKYNLPTAPLPIQLLIYCFIGGFAAIINITIFMLLHNHQISVNISAPVAFLLAAFVNYFLCIALLFRHKSRWKSVSEIFVYLLVVAIVGVFDWYSLNLFLNIGILPILSKTFATGIVLFLNFIGRRFLVFPEPSSGPWQKQEN